MRTVLAIDTSTDVASLALMRGDDFVWEREIPSQRSHSAALFPALMEAADQGCSIDRIAVGLGPGSFAGIRIAIAAAMGLRAVWKCELVGLPSVLGLAAPSESYMALGDARRGTWYYSRVETGECLDGPRLIETDADLQQLLSGNPLASGFENEEVRLRSALQAAVDQPSDSASSPGQSTEALALFSTDAVALRWGAQLRRPSAQFLARLAYSEKSLWQRHELEPLYLREPHITLPKT